MRDAIKNAIREAVSVPAHVQACASAVRYDLLHGPAFARIPPEGIEHFTADHFATFAEDLDDTQGELVQVYSSAVADTLREFIDALPTLYYQDWSGCVLSEAEDDECGELDGRDITRALFGDTIADPFN